MAEQAQGVWLQAAVVPDEPWCCGSHHSLQAGHTTGKTQVQVIGNEMLDFQASPTTTSRRENTMQPEVCKHCMYQE